MKKEPILKKGVALIAAPMLNNDFFRKSVIYITRHDDASSLGFILNRQLKLYMGMFFPQIKETIPIYQGGPVDTDTLFFIHNIPSLLPGSIQIDESAYWGGDFETLKNLLSSGEAKGENVRFFLGYTGWDAGQLDDEVKEKNWLIESTPLNPITHFNENMWSEYLCGGDVPEITWDNAPEDIQMN
ncbi:MAG: YqgE/AlgH family protein [Flavobacteriales bacterium]|nr:YqgE/AlgH family protein [Flavobacteriales bacterium]